MDYKQSLRICIRDLEDYQTENLLLMGEYYGVPVSNKKRLCKALGEQFIGKLFPSQTAQMPPRMTRKYCMRPEETVVKYWEHSDTPDYIMEFVRANADKLCSIIELMGKSDKSKFVTFIYPDIYQLPDSDIWMVEGTNFIVESPENNTIIGKIENEKHVPLTDRDIEKAQTNGWKVYGGKEIIPRDSDVLNRHALFSLASFNGQDWPVIKYATELEKEPHKYAPFRFYGFSSIVNDYDLDGFIQTFFTKGVYFISTCNVECFNWFLDHFKPEIIEKYANVRFREGEILPKVEHEDLERYILEWAQVILEQSIDLDMIKAILAKLGNKLLYTKELFITVADHDDMDFVQKKIKLILHNFGKPSDELIKEITDGLTRNPTVRGSLGAKVIAEEFGIDLYPYKTRNQIMQAMARKEITRKKGLELIKELATAPPPPVVIEEEEALPVKASDCSNAVDYFTQERWSDENLPEIKIKFLPKDPTREPYILCIDKESLIKWLNDPENEMRGWYPNADRIKMSKDMELEGYGGRPSEYEQFYKMPGIPDYIWNPKYHAELLIEKNNSLVAYPIYTGKRLGDPSGVFGVSMNHGQIPGFTVYFLTYPTDEEDVRKKIVNLAREVYMLKGQNPEDIGDDFSIPEINDKLEAVKLIVPANDLIDDAQITPILDPRQDRAGVSQPPPLVDLQASLIPSPTVPRPEPRPVQSYADLYPERSEFEVGDRDTYEELEELMQDLYDQNDCTLMFIRRPDDIDWEYAIIACDPEDINVAQEHAQEAGYTEHILIPGFDPTTPIRIEYKELISEFYDKGDPAGVASLFKDLRWWWDTQSDAELFAKALEAFYAERGNECALRFIRKSADDDWIYKGLYCKQEVIRTQWETERDEGYTEMNLIPWTLFSTTNVQLPETVITEDDREIVRKNVRLLRGDILSWYKNKALDNFLAQNGWSAMFITTYDPPNISNWEYINMYDNASEAGRDWDDNYIIEYKDYILIPGFVTIRDERNDAIVRDAIQPESEISGANIFVQQLLDSYAPNIQPISEFEESERGQLLQTAELLANQTKCAMMWFRKDPDDNWEYSGVYCNMGDIQDDWEISQERGYKERKVFPPLSVDEESLEAVTEMLSLQDIKLLMGTDVAPGFGTALDEIKRLQEMGLSEWYKFHHTEESEDLEREQMAPAIELLANQIKCAMMWVRRSGSWLYTGVYCNIQDLNITWQDFQAQGYIERKVFPPLNEEEDQFEAITGMLSLHDVKLIMETARDEIERLHTEGLTEWYRYYGLII